MQYVAVDVSTIHVPFLVISQKTKFVSQVAISVRHTTSVGRALTILVSHCADPHQHWGRARSSLERIEDDIDHAENHAKTRIDNYNSLQYTRSRLRDAVDHKVSFIDMYIAPRSLLVASK